MSDDFTDIQNAKADLRKFMTQWRGQECIDVEFEVRGNEVHVTAEFVLRIGRE